MKKILILSTAFMFGSGIAADNSMELLNDLVGQLSKGGFEKIADESQNFAQCMSKLDQEELDQQQQKSEKVIKQVRAICAKGERDKAQKMYMDFYHEQEQSKLGKEVKACTDKSSFFKDKIDQLMKIHPCDNNFLDFSNFN